VNIQFKKLTSLSFGIIPFTIKGFSTSFQLYGTAKLKPKFCSEGRPLEIKSILIVDDQADLLRAMSGRIAKKLGIKTACVDPECDISIRDQVFDAIETDPPDMIIVDGNLGKSPTGEKQTGTEIIKELRSRGFKGYIVANSNDPILNWEMMDGGADFNARGKYTKHDKTKQLALFINKYFQGDQ